MMTDSISIVLITYNRQISLEKCLDSISRQNVSPDEVIIVDNGSQDKTRDIVGNYRDRLPINYSFIPRTSIPKARNLAIEKAKSDILIMIDDDCFLDSDHIQKVKNCYEDNPDIDYLAYKIDYLKTSCLLNKVFVLSLQSFFKRKYFPGNAIVAKGYLPMSYSSIASSRSETLKRLPYVFDEKFLVSEDTELSVRLKKAGCRVFFDPDIIVYHDCAFKSFISFITKYFFYAKGEVRVKKLHKHLETFPKITDYFNFISDIFKSNRHKTFEKIYISAIYTARSATYVVGYLYWHFFPSG